MMSEIIKIIIKFTFYVLQYTFLQWFPKNIITKAFVITVMNDFGLKFPNGCLHDCGDHFMEIRYSIMNSETREDNLLKFDPYKMGYLGF